MIKMIGYGNRFLSELFSISDIQQEVMGDFWLRSFFETNQLYARNSYPRYCIDAAKLKQVKLHLCDLGVILL